MTSSNDRDDVLSSVLIETVDEGIVTIGRIADRHDAERPAVVNTYVTCTGDTVTVTGYRGTQATGYTSGDPLNLTQFGGVDVQVTSTEGVTVGLSFSDSDDLSNLLDALNHARRVADSRDQVNDVPRNNR